MAGSDLRDAALDQVEMTGVDLRGVNLENIRRQVKASCNELFSPTG